MINSNLHTHSIYCDGKASLSTYVESAINLGFSSLGFSSHAPLPFKNLWSMKEETLSRYLAEIQSLKSVYKDRIEIYTGLEADYIDQVVSTELLKQNYPAIDYLIGSVHFVQLDSSGELVEIDGSHTRFLSTCKSEGVAHIVKKYYAATRQMIKTQPIDIVGHLDKVKIQNRRTRLFNEKDNWYQKEIEETLNVIKNTPVIMEVNTRGMYKQIVKEPYPSWWIIEKAISMGIKMTLSSDTHHPKELQLGFKEVTQKLKQLGCEGLYFMINGKWTKEMI